MWQDLQLENSMTTPIGGSPGLPFRTTLPSTPPIPGTRRIETCALAALNTTTTLLSALEEFHFSAELRTSCAQLCSSLHSRTIGPETLKQMISVAHQIQKVMWILEGKTNALADVHVHLATGNNITRFDQMSFPTLVSEWQQSLGALLIQFPTEIYADDPLLATAISDTDRSSQIKIASLPPEVQREFGAFERELCELAPLICDYGWQSQQGFDTKQLDIAIRPKIKTFLSKHPALNCSGLINPS